MVQSTKNMKNSTLIMCIALIGSVYYLDNQLSVPAYQSLFKGSYINGVIFQTIVFLAVLVVMVKAKLIKKLHNRIFYVALIYIFIGAAKITSTNYVIRSNHETQLTNNIQKHRAAHEQQLKTMLTKKEAEVDEIVRERSFKVESIEGKFESDKSLYHQELSIEAQNGGFGNNSTGLHTAIQKMFDEHQKNIERIESHYSDRVSKLDQAYPLLVPRTPQDELEHQNELNTKFRIQATHDLRSKLFVHDLANEQLPILLDVLNVQLTLEEREYLSASLFTVISEALMWVLFSLASSTVAHHFAAVKAKSESDALTHRFTNETQLRAFEAFIQSSSQQPSKT